MSRVTPLRAGFILPSAALFVLGAAYAGASPAHDAKQKSAFPSEPSHAWRLVDGKHWQIVGPEGEPPDVTDAQENNRGACKAGMVEVKGQMRVTDLGDELQKSICKNWITREFPERCAEFDRDKWLKLAASLPTRAMHFCIDRYEYPNRKGAYPIILMDWHEANAVCGREGKRLCTEDEWTFACEGEEATPYPYGYVRDKDACIVDKPWRPYRGTWALGRGKKEAMLELDFLWQGVASGSQPRCKSPFGVYDMIGNIDEWTRSSKPGRPSILKGGYWGPVRTRCRPTTRAHGETHAFYQQGVRCCALP